MCERKRRVSKFSLSHTEACGPHFPGEQRERFRPGAHTVKGLVRSGGNVLSLVLAASVSQARGKHQKDKISDCKLAGKPCEVLGNAWHESEAPVLAPWPLAKPPRLKRPPKLTLTYLDFPTGLTAATKVPQPFPSSPTFPASTHVTPRGDTQGNTLEPLGCAWMLGRPSSLLCFQLLRNQGALKGLGSRGGDADGFLQIPSVILIGRPAW